MPNEPKVEHPSVENAKSPLKTWRILFLDGAENIEKLKDACKDSGNTAVGALTIAEAWTFLRGKDHVDVIVCAAHLEEGSMFEFLKGLRDSKDHGDVRFLILSLEPTATGALLDRSAKRAGMALGADAYVVMPRYDGAQLVEQIRLLQPLIPTLQQSATPEEKERSE